MRFTSQKIPTVILLALASVAVSGCEIQRANQAADAQAAMIGMSKEQILACMGPPANDAVAGGTEVWTYNSGNGRTDTVGIANGWGGNGFASVFGSSTTTTRFCKVDVVMSGARVSRINYTGPTGGLLTRGEQCAFAVANCAGPAGFSAPVAAPVTLPAPAISASVTNPDVAPAPTNDASSETASASISGDVLPRCTKEDMEMVRLAKANGYHYSATCR